MKENDSEDEKSIKSIPKDPQNYLNELGLIKETEDGKIIIRMRRCDPFGLLAKRDELKKKKKE
jgi:hypothetical protein